MRKLLLIFMMLPLGAFAAPYFKCEAGGAITYSDKPCFGGEGESVRLQDKSRRFVGEWSPGSRMKTREELAREQNERALRRSIAQRHKEERQHENSLRMQEKMEKNKRNMECRRRVAARQYRSSEDKRRDLKECWEY